VAFRQAVQGLPGDIVVSKLALELDAVSAVSGHGLPSFVRAGMQALLLQHKAGLKGIWASFDGQAYIIDDLLRAQGVKRGEIALVSIDGGAETRRRIADPESTLMATVAIPFEEMGKKAVDSIDAIVVRKQPVGSITSGPYLFLDAVLVDSNNVKAILAN
jgi:ABC-type sugar transport system substrate-binding protein